MDVEPMKGGEQARSWCFTAWTEEEAQKIAHEDGVKAICIGKEICPTTGKEHYQGYIRFATNKRFSWWKREYPTVHVERRRGAEHEAAAYCRKENQVMIDRGCQLPTLDKDPTENALDMMEKGISLHHVYLANRKWFFHNYQKIKNILPFIHQNYAAQQLDVTYP